MYGVDEVAEWLTTQATRSCDVIVGAIEQWDGPGDVDFGHDISLTLPEYKQRYLLHSYARAVLASAYLVQEATKTSLGGLYRISLKIRSLLGCGKGDLSLDEALLALPNMFGVDGLPPSFAEARTASYMRNDLLQPENPLTSANSSATTLLVALVLSAFVSTRLGVPCPSGERVISSFSQTKGNRRASSASYCVQYRTMLPQRAMNTGCKHDARFCGSGNGANQPRLPSPTRAAFFR